MTDIAVIILQKNEALHIRRCLEKLRPLEPRQVFVVDCLSTDGSNVTAKEMGATVVYHEWPGNQARQFNWSLDNLPVDTGWILRLDVDEWLTQELIEEIKSKLPKMNEEVDGVVLKRRLYFKGKWVKHGVYPTRIVRLFRKGKARYDDHAAMDEHLIVEGKTNEFEYDFADESLITLEEWKTKHRNYAEREARMALSGAVNANKKMYYRLPRYFRAFAFFCVRYFLKGGFLDGWAGLYWNFWQGLWYRWLVDRKIGELEKVNV